MNPSLVDVNFFLGRAYLLNNSYDEAVEQFNLQMAKETDPTEKLKLKQYLVNCLSAKAISATITNNKVINAGTNLNSAAEEFAPMLYNNDMNIIFTYKGLKSTGVNLIHLAKRILQDFIMRIFFNLHLSDRNGLCLLV